MPKEKFSRDEIQAEVKLFNQAVYKRFGNHSYAAGYFESKIATILAMLPRHKQAEILVSLRQSTAVVELTCGGPGYEGRGLTPRDNVL